MLLFLNTEIEPKTIMKKITHNQIQKKKKICLTLTGEKKIQITST